MTTLFDRVGGQDWESPVHVVGRQLAEALCRRPLDSGLLFLAGHILALLNPRAGLGSQFAGLCKRDFRVATDGQLAGLASEAVAEHPSRGSLRRESERQAAAVSFGDSLPGLDPVPNLN